MGKYHVMVCGTTPCMLQGARTIYKTLKEHLGVDYGQTTAVSSSGLKFCRQLLDCQAAWPFCIIHHKQVYHAVLHSQSTPAPPRTGLQKD